MLGLSRSVLEGTALYLLFGLSIAAAVTATLLLVAQIGASPRRPAGTQDTSRSPLPSILAGAGCVLGLLALAHIVSGVAFEGGSAAR